MEATNGLGYVVLAVFRELIRASSLAAPGRWEQNIFTNRFHFLKIAQDNIFWILGPGRSLGQGRGRLVFSGSVLLAILLKPSKRIGSQDCCR